MHCPLSASHSRTSWSREPLATSAGLRGWKRTTQGVRRWPDRTRTRRPVEQQLSLTVWSPLRVCGWGVCGCVGGGLGGWGGGWGGGRSGLRDAGWGGHRGGTRRQGGHAGGDVLKSRLNDPTAHQLQPLSCTHCVEASRVPSQL